MDMRRVRVGCEFVYAAAVDTPAVFQVEPLDAAPVSLARREWSTEPEVRIRHYTDLYGNPCTRVTLPAGPATLALRTDATLVVAACYSGPGRDHFAAVTPPIDTARTGKLREDVRRVTQLVAHELEGLIQRAPEQWHVLESRFAS